MPSSRPFLLPPFHSLFLVVFLTLSKLFSLIQLFVVTHLLTYLSLLIQIFFNRFVLLLCICSIPFSFCVPRLLIFRFYLFCPSFLLLSFCYFPYSYQIPSYSLLPPPFHSPSSPVSPPSCCHLRHFI